MQTQDLSWKGKTYQAFWGINIEKFPKRLTPLLDIRVFFSRFSSKEIACEWETGAQPDRKPSSACFFVFSMLHVCEWRRFPPLRKAILALQPLLPSAVIHSESRLTCWKCSVSNTSVKSYSKASLHLGCWLWKLLSGLIQLCFELLSHVTEIHVSVDCLWLPSLTPAWIKLMWESPSNSSKNSWFFSLVLFLLGLILNLSLFSSDATSTKMRRSSSHVTVTLGIQFPQTLACVNTSLIAPPLWNQLHFLTTQQLHHCSSHLWGFEIMTLTFLEFLSDIEPCPVLPSCFSGLSFYCHSFFCLPPRIGFLPITAEYLSSWPSN